jgi:hypothetical protein
LRRGFTVQDPGDWILDFTEAVNKKYAMRV